MLDGHTYGDFQVRNLLIQFCDVNLQVINLIIIGLLLVFREVVECSRKVCDIVGEGREGDSNVIRFFLEISGLLCRPYIDMHCCQWHFKMSTSLIEVKS